MLNSRLLMSAAVAACVTVLSVGRAEAITVVGLTQGNPVIVTPVGNLYTFSNPFTGLWYDPPPAALDGFEYSLSSGHFTSFTTPTTPLGTLGIYVGGVEIGTIAANQTYTFSGAYASSVTNFELGNFSPLLAATTTAYPIQLNFTNAPATLTINGLTSPVSVPEPASMLLLGAGVAGLAAARRKRAAQS